MTPEAAALVRERYTRVQAALARHGVGALLIATPNLGLLASGARRVLVAGSGGTLPWVVVPAGAASATVFTTDPDGAPDWMPRAAIEPLRWSRDAQLARIAALVARTRGPLACDVYGPVVQALAERLGRPLRDAAPLLAEVAAEKTPREVALVADALAAARAGVTAAAAAVVPGAAPAAGVARFAAAMSASGAGFPLSEGLWWRAGRRIVAGETFGADDVVAFELGVWVSGVTGIAGETVACAADLDPERRRWSAALCALAKACRAGATTADLRRAAREAGATQLGLVAHGLGVGIEPPYVDLDADDADPVRAGTVLVLAPVVDGVRATRALVVTDGAPRWIEGAP